MQKTEQREQEIAEARERLVRGMRKQLLGPGSEVGEDPAVDEAHEIITSSPVMRYTCGVLYPQPSLMGTQDAPDIPETEAVALDGDVAADDDPVQKDDDELGIKVDEKDLRLDAHGEDDDADAFSEELSRAGQMQPSSFGMTFFADHPIDEVRVDVSFGTYAVLPEEETSEEDEGKKKRKRYQRTPHDLPGTRLIFHGEEHASVELLPEDDEHRIELCGMRRRMPGGAMSVTLMLVNHHPKGDRVVPEPEECIFQPELKVSSEENGIRFRAQESVEQALGGSSVIGQGIEPDEEELRLAMLYRKNLRYASGFGVSVDWNIDAEGKGSLHSEFLPSAELPPMDYGLRLDSAVDVPRPESLLSMKYYSDLAAGAWEQEAREERLQQLTALVESYQKWIDAQEHVLRTDPWFAADAKREQIGRQDIENCREAADRMAAGIELLREDDDVRTAFALANRAMFMQRVQLAKQRNLGQKKRYAGDKETQAMLQSMDFAAELDQDAKWRPFQLAFLLMSLRGMTEREGAAEERMLVDLIWFPTGGGKTEAYLGLSAFTIFYRRLAHPEDYGGTNIIMRYTLRMLTAQQFTRAATLICACELIRREDEERFCEEPVTIGLWIGGNHVPNKFSGSKDYPGALENLNALKNDRSGNAVNRLQILRCPWCGTEMVPEHKGKQAAWGYHADKESFYFSCPHEACPFHGEDEYGENPEEALPLQVIDEGLYQHPPTLLIGTIDKFAQIAWQEKMQAFFRGRGPELIIQDELHLISGPLGSIDGLYEMALDEIFRSHGHQPKIIASTATIRRAKAQCMALYCRDVRQFPPPGIDAEDSYFSKTDCTRSGRMYLGVLPASARKATMEYLMISDLAGLTAAIDMPENVRDAFWTLTAYFNSIRELGHCLTLVSDEVQGELKSFAKRMKCQKRTLLYPEELTSRTSSTKLNEILEKLEHVQYHDGIDKLPREERNYPIGMVLASNMLSVGIDVGRLNLMLMVGQPKLASEYIQASSRVGRQVPGLVFVLYDACRSRDRSYYEQFRAFHTSFYRYVEPTGATPFSRPACDRALHAAALGVLRCQKELSPDKGAAVFDEETYHEAIEPLIASFQARARRVQEALGMQPERAEAYVRQRLERFFAAWDSRAKSEDQLTYGTMYDAPRKKEKPQLLAVYGSPNAAYGEWETLTSMRFVDQGIAGNLRFKKEG